MNKRSLQRMEDAVRSRNRREEKKRAEAGDSLPLEDVNPLLVRLKKDVGKIPAKIDDLFPRDLAIRFIHRRYAVPLANFDAEIDLEVTDDQLMHAGLPPELIPLEAVVETVLETELEAA